MYIALIIILVVLFALIGWSLISTYLTLSKTYRLAHGAPRHTGYFTLGNSKKPEFKLLILGDSIGAAFSIPDFKDTVGARIAAALSKQYYVTYVNRAALGNWISDILHEPIEGKWDMIVQITASNDVLHGIDQQKFDQDCLKLAKNMRAHSDKVIIAGPGDTTTVTLFPWWLKLIFRRRQLKVSEAFKKAAEGVGAVYVNTLNEPRLTMNLGADNLHLNAKGDEILFDCIWSKIKEQGWFKDL